MYELIKKLNPDNYEAYIDAKCTEDIIYKMIQHYDDNGYFDNIIEGEPEEDIMTPSILSNGNEELRQKIEHIESILSWAGPGEYCLVGHEFGCECITKVKDMLQSEFESIDFPFPLNVNMFSNFEDYIASWKKDEGYEYIYIVDHRKTSNEPSHEIDYIVYSNEEIGDVFETLLEEKGLLVGAFGQLGANCNAYPVEDFDIGELSNYKLEAFQSYEKIYLQP